jgi:hypothetical protein
VAIVDIIKKDIGDQYDWDNDIKVLFNDVAELYNHRELLKSRIADLNNLFNKMNDIHIKEKLFNDILDEKKRLGSINYRYNNRRAELKKYDIDFNGIVYKKLNNKNKKNL